MTLILKLVFNNTECSKTYWRVRMHNYTTYLSSEKAGVNWVGLASGELVHRHIKLFSDKNIKILINESKKIRTITPNFTLYHNMRVWFNKLNWYRRRNFNSYESIFSEARTLFTSCNTQSIPELMPPHTTADTLILAILYLSKSKDYSLHLKDSTMTYYVR